MSVEDRSRTDDFVTADMPDVVVEDAICNGGWDFKCCCISCSRVSLAFSSIVN